MTTAADLARQEELERRYDGPIPAHVLNPKSEREHMADHHRAMVRYHTTRRQDFTESLAKVEAMSEDTDDQRRIKAIWLQHTRKSLAEHVQELARHEAEVAALTAPAVSQAAE